MFSKTLPSAGHTTGMLCMAAFRFNALMHWMHQPIGSPQHQYPGTDCPWHESLLHMPKTLRHSWRGAVESRTSRSTTRATALPIMRRKTSPTAMGRTPGWIRDRSTSAFVSKLPNQDQTDQVILAFPGQSNFFVEGGINWH